MSPLSLGWGDQLQFGHYTKLLRIVIGLTKSVQVLMQPHDKIRQWLIMHMYICQGAFSKFVPCVSGEELAFGV